MGINGSKKGIGIVGYGGFGEFLREAWDAMDEAHVVAVCDSDASRNPGDIRFYSEFTDLLTDADVDIVSVATPPSTHKNLAIQAMQAGKHVLVEKPLALNEKDALLIKRVSDSTGRVATVNFILRFNVLVQSLSEIVSSQVLGRLRRADLRNYAAQDGVPEGHWFWKPEVSGKIMLEHGVHFFDLANALIKSRVFDVLSLGLERKPGMEDRVFAAVTYENGTVGTYWHSFSRPRELETTAFHFAFDLGEIEMIGWIPLELRIWGWTNQVGLDVIKNSPLCASIEAVELSRQTARSSEFDYPVSHEIRAVLKLADPKSQVYADCIRALMADMIRRIDDPTHAMRVTLDDAIEAVRTAERATAISPFQAPVLKD